LRVGFGPGKEWLVVTRTLFLVAALALGNAPLQCGSGESEGARYETPPEALYELAQRFKKQGNDGSHKQTLEFLIERYPNSRFAVRARNELGQSEP
jgi:outer membrane protein assembly factor BamD (BamD/ComL family)